MPPTITQPLVLFTAQTAMPIRTAHAEVLVCADWADFLQRQVVPLGFLICDGTVAQIEQLAQQIRTSLHRHRL
ncbi:MAG: hypothetical protein RJA44_1629, partial [Pseudomonadota bacterium]